MIIKSMPNKKASRMAREAQPYILNDKMLLKLNFRKKFYLF